MKFGPVPLDQAEGAVLAHSIALADRRLRKGAVLNAEQVAALRASGCEEVMAARLDPGDIGEDAATSALARALVPDPASAWLRLTKAFTGGGST